MSDEIIRLIRRAASAGSWLGGQHEDDHDLLRSMRRRHPGHHSVISFKAGSKRHDEPLDLCLDCTERFNEWLNGPRGGPCQAVGASPAIEAVIGR